MVFSVRNFLKNYIKRMQIAKKYFYVYFNEIKYNIEKELLTILANKNYLEGSKLIGTEIDETVDSY